MSGDIGHIRSEPTHFPERKELKIRLIQEELNELSLSENPVDAADALADLLYVVFGAVIEYGFSDRIGAIFDEVHRSNMSKGCKDVDEVAATLAKYKEQGVEAWGDGLVVRRKSDGKILKSINYSPADIGQFISPQSNDQDHNQADTQPGAIETSSHWKMIEIESSAKGIFITQALQVAGGILLRVKGYNSYKECIGIENTYIPDLHIVEKLEKTEEGVIARYSLEGIAI